MKPSNNFWKIVRAAGFVLGLPLLSFAVLLFFFLGQIGIVGIADRFGISPLVGFNVLNIILISFFAGFLIFVKRQPETLSFFRRLRAAFPRFGFPNFRFPSWELPRFRQDASMRETVSVPRRAKEPICKILFIHYQPAAQNNAADTLTFDYQNDAKTYVNTNNFYEP